MAKYRKKSIIVEATQWHVGDPPLPGMQKIPWVSSLPEPDDPDFVIKTVIGNKRVKDGDWIVTGIKGGRYPIKDEIFKMTYELVDDG